MGYTRDIGEETGVRYLFYTADVFTDRVFGGNPLAVVTDARGLDDASMQSVAREFNLSETVFLFPPEDPRNSRRLRIFTPAMELPFAGHPTVGAAFVLAAIGALDGAGDQIELNFEEEVGVVPVRIRIESGAPVFAELTAARLPEQLALTVAAAEIGSWLGVPGDSVLKPPWTPEIWSCGVPFLFVPLRDLRAVGDAGPPAGRGLTAFEATGAHGIFPFCRYDEAAMADVHGRMFAPELGIGEDPATGGAAAAMAGYLAAREAPEIEALSWRLEQGVEMGRPSLLRIRVDRDRGAVTSVGVGGSAVMVSRGEIDVPTAAS